MSDLATYLSQLATTVGDSARYISNSAVYVGDKKNFLNKLRQQSTSLIPSISSDGNGLKVKKHLVELGNICNVTTTILSEGQIALISKALLQLQKEIEKDARLMVSNLKLTPFQAALAYASIHNTPLVMRDFLLGSVGSKSISSKSDYDLLISKFKADPYVVLASMAQAMRVLGVNSQVVSKHIDEFFQLQLILDSEVFSSTGKNVYSGILNYIPDRFSDLGSDYAIEDDKRSREKILVSKKDIFTQSRGLFVSIFSMPQSIIEAVINELAFFVNKNLPYDYVKFANVFGGTSIPVHGGFNSKVPISVCRHQALYAAVLLQALGIPTRLLKCTMKWKEGTVVKSGAHVANIIFIKGVWCLLDVTNYSRINGAQQLRLVSTGKANVDLNKEEYTFSVDTDAGRTEYTTRSNAFYRIR